MRRINFSLFLLLFLLSTASLAQVPSSINYQGVLKDSTGLVDHPGLQMTFSIYNVKTGGTPFWTETQTVAVKGGLYSVQLGSETEITQEVFSGIPRYLGVTIAGEKDEMKPRIQLNTVPYAFVSEVASRSAVTDSLSDAALQQVSEEVVSVPYAARSGVTDSLSDAALQQVDTRTVSVPDPLIPANGPNQDIIGGLTAYSTINPNVSGKIGELEIDIVKNYTRGTGVYGQADDNNKGFIGYSYTSGSVTMGAGVYAGGDDYGVRGESSTGGIGASGYNSGDGLGVKGESESGYGVWGESKGSDAGVYGKSATGIGVIGSGATGGGVYGASGSLPIHVIPTGHGVIGEVDKTNKAGVFGNNTNSGEGVRGESASGDGVYGSSGASNKAGVRGESTSGVGIHGSGLTYGVLGESANRYGVYGSSSSSRPGYAGVYGINTAAKDGGAGVEGKSTSGDGVYGTSTNRDGVYGTSTTGYAGRFVGGKGLYGSTISAGHIESPFKVITKKYEGVDNIPARAQKVFNIGPGKDVFLLSTTIAPTIGPDLWTEGKTTTGDIIVSANYDRSNGDVTVTSLWNVVLNVHVIVIYAD